MELLVAVISFVAAVVASTDGVAVNLQSRASHGAPFKSPTFSATSKELSVPEGSDVSFPCDFDTKESQGASYVMIFKYVSPKDEDRIYFAGDTKVTHFPRMRKVGSSFVLRDVQVSDLGSYACRFETKPLTQIVHKLQVLYPPKIRKESAEVQRVSQGSNVLLQCSADGNPTPTISWSRQGGFLPSGVQSIEGLSITLKEVDRHVEGTYVCTAFNGIGDSESASLTVEVEYPPEINSEQTIIHTGEGDNARLVCVVHGRPAPDVTWLRGDNLVSSDKHVMTHDGAHRHTLSISSVSEEDFGEYTCRAQNNLGTMENKLKITGLPQQPHFTSSPNGTARDSYNLSWVTETSSPIVQYQLRYRKVGNWKQSRDLGSSKWIESKYFPKNENLSQVRQGVYQIKHPLTNLMSDEQFEAQVQVENKFGWSQTSDSFTFRTKRAEPTTTTTMDPFPQIFNNGPQVEEVAAGNTSNSRSISTSSHYIVILIIAILNSYCFV